MPNPSAVKIFFMEFAASNLFENDFAQHSCTFLSKSVIRVVKVNVMWKKGLARTQIPTNRNYAPELPTFGVIAGVSYSVVQWSSLALREPPWWSWLALVPGKYALLVSRGNLSQISSGGALLSKIQISGLAAGIVKIISSSTGRKQPL